MRGLREVWDAVGIFSYQASRYRLYAKVSYFLMLLIAAATTILTVVSINRPDWIGDDERARCVLGLSIAGSVLAGLTAYVQPAQRWFQLRGAALNLESEVWKFRTRSGQYALTQNREMQDEVGEEHLMAFLDRSFQTVLKTASVSKTGLYAKFELFGQPKNLCLVGSITANTEVVVPTAHSVIVLMRMTTTHHYHQIITLS
jgi:hypothetical protein